MPCIALCSGCIPDHAPKLRLARRIGDRELGDMSLCSRSVIGAKPSERTLPPYLHPPVSASVRRRVVRWWLRWSEGWLSLLPVPDSCRSCERAGGSTGRAAPAQQSREVKGRAGL